MPSETVKNLLDFDIDRYLNPWVPHNRLYVLPKPISRWLGYRSEPHKEPPALLQWPITFLATVGALCLVAGVYNYAPGISKWNPPVIVASLGASAVLDYSAIRSPLAQPRNAIIGNALAAICGVAIAKLFQLNSDFQNITWLSGAVGCAVASLVMSATGTVHPPGGATALLASTEKQIVAMGWNFVPLMLVGTVLMTTVALIFNNIFRQYPVFWWTSTECGRRLRQERQEERDEERGELRKGGLKDGSKDNPGKVVSDTDSDRTLNRQESVQLDQVVITPYDFVIPPHLQLSDEETGLLEAIRGRLWAQVI